jgi:hypothetical protein
MAAGSMAPPAGEAFPMFMPSAKPPIAAVSSACGRDEFILWEELHLKVPIAPRIEP